MAEAGDFERSSETNESQWLNFNKKVEEQRLQLCRKNNEIIELKKDLHDATLIRGTLIEVLNKQLQEEKQKNISLNEEVSVATDEIARLNRELVRIEKRYYNLKYDYDRVYKFYDVVNKANQLYLNSIRSDGGSYGPG